MQTCVKVQLTTIRHRCHCCCRSLQYKMVPFSYICHNKNSWCRAIIALLYICICLWGSGVSCFTPLSLVSPVPYFQTSPTIANTSILQDTLIVTGDTKQNWPGPESLLTPVYSLFWLHGEWWKWVSWRAVTCHLPCSPATSTATDSCLQCLTPMCLVQPCLAPQGISQPSDCGLIIYYLKFHLIIHIHSYVYWAQVWQTLYAPQWHQQTQSSVSVVLFAHLSFWILNKQTYSAQHC